MDEANVLKQTGYWTLVRHGGRSSDAWRRVGKIMLDQSAGIAAFLKVKEKMRQGGLALLDTTGRVDRFYAAPLLRTRW